VDKGNVGEKKRALVRAARSSFYRNLLAANL
jgi:hypothetical protein